MQALSSSTAHAPYAVNDSKGCGTIMRVAPVGLLILPARVREVAIATSKITHGNPTAIYSASIWAELISAVMLGEKLEHAVGTKLDDYKKIEDTDEVRRSINAALELPRDGSLESVRALGQGWVAEECLSIALYSCLYSLELVKSGYSVRDAILNGLFCAARHPGDSDSTAAVAGNMLGLLFSVEVIHDVLRSFWSIQVGEKLVDKLLEQHMAISDPKMLTKVDRDYVAPN
ncbi:ADP-ribosylglycohydrolase family protein [Agrobacterium larrymoorei]|uniref:ADP-ribosylglycohydrolase family protein n=1 Tax=Agrobacterium larrymoorei TaxID=160699 RepID=UPI003D03B797